MINGLRHCEDPKPFQLHVDQQRKSLIKAQLRQ